MFKITLILVILALVFGFMMTSQKDKKIKGITVVAPPREFTKDPMSEIKEIHAEWIALVPYAFTKNGIPELHYGTQYEQWWGERKEGIIECIRLARNSGLKVMIKPQVYIHSEWTGDLEFSSIEDWIKWENDYENYIMTFVKLAKEYKVEMICIGTELLKSTELRPDFWSKLIQKIRSEYSGMLTYSDNWDHYQKISFWEQLDYIGISAYFPISEKHNPSQEILLDNWVKWKKELSQFSQFKNKKILFSEFGYLSVDGAAGKSWELEKNIGKRPINQSAQADGFNALFSSLWIEEWWAGGFIWKWFPEGLGHEGYPERDYTPQSKKAEKIISQWYSKS
ncbi:MAG: hypothetical protein IT267_05650 [Saprospiraceae bacterium]|nr:hypothetical protein [Saprospiraceae bacterium]